MTNFWVKNQVHLPKQMLSSCCVQELSRSNEQRASSSQALQAVCSKFSGETAGYRPTPFAEDSLQSKSQFSLSKVILIGTLKYARYNFKINPINKPRHVEPFLQSSTTLKNNLLTKQNRIYSTFKIIKLFHVKNIIFAKEGHTIGVFLIFASIFPLLR